MAEVSLENVTKVFPGDVVAVNDVSLSVADREFMVLVGPSGCGKSTTLRLIAGLEEVTRGRIRIGQRLVNDVPPKDRDIAMVFQNYALYPHMSVYKNMAFGLKLRGYGRGEVRARVMEAAEILGLTALMKRKPRALSGGQQQRVALGRAIVRKPKVFLFDEPLSNLDAKLRVQMRAELSKLHRRLQTTVIYVTHDQVEAMTLGQRIAVLEGGVVKQVASPLELYDRPANRFVGGFIGSPPMNFFEGTLRAQDGRLAFDRGAWCLPLPVRLSDGVGRWAGRPVVLGIRPEDLRVGPAASAPARAPRMAAVVTVVEQLGDEQLVHLNSGGDEFIARTDAHDRTDVGTAVEVDFEEEKIHLFERDSGANLASVAAQGTCARDAGSRSTA